MSRVASLTNMPEAQLNRWIRRVALLLVVVLIGFVAFYVVDRYRAPAPTIVEREQTALEQAVRDNPADTSSRGRLADIYVAAGRLDEAITQYTEIITSGNSLEAAYAGRARALELKGDLTAAAADYNEVVKLGAGGEQSNVDKALAAAYFGLGSIAMEQDKPAEAVDQFQKSMAINRSDSDTLNMLGKAYVAAGQPDAAIDTLRRAVLFVPVGWAEPYQTLADAYTATGETEMAAWAAAMAVGQAGDATEAVAQLTTLVDGKAALDARIGLGLMAELGGDGTTAASWYSQALELDSTNQSALLGLSRVSTGTQGHPSIEPSPSAEGSN